jgi:single-strand DNA-binding protein
MASFNKVILMGNLTRDPEIRQAGATGIKVADLRLAVSESWRDKNGQTKEVTCFVDVVVWDRLAELCSQYLSKGSPVLVEGRLQLDEWQNQQGEKRSKLRVRAATVKFLGTRSTQAEAQPGVPATQTATSASSDNDLSEELDSAAELAQDDEDLPF